jgi:hypothetical protein
LGKKVNHFDFSSNDKVLHGRRERKRKSVSYFREQHDRDEPVRKGVKRVLEVTRNFVML